MLACKRPGMMLRGLCDPCARWEVMSEGGLELVPDLNLDTRILEMYEPRET